MINITISPHKGGIGVWQQHILTPLAMHLEQTNVSLLHIWYKSTWNLKYL